MGDIDNTRDRLKLDELNKDARKDLFNKFVDAGGEVVADKKRDNGNTLVGSSKKGQNVVVGGNSGRSSKGSSFANSKSDAKDKNNKSSSTITIPNKKNNGLFFNVKLWFNALSSGVITLMGGNVNPKFLNFIDKNVIAALLEMDTLIFNALNPSEASDIDAKAKHQKVISQFSKTLDDLELLERIKDQYNEGVYKDFLRPYKELNSTVMAESYVKEIKAMFRPLYVLHAYSSRIKLAVEKAMFAYAMVDNISKGIVNSRISAFKRAVDLIYGKYYPKLFTLLQYASKEPLETINDFNRYLNITDEDILGYYTKLRKEKEKLQETKIEQAKENIGKQKDNEEEKLSKVESIGIKLIDKCVSFKKSDNNIEYEADPFFIVPIKDKIYRIKVLIDFLDREYSAVFVSNKVRYNLVYDNQVRTDYKNDFNNIFLSLSDTNSRLNEYSELCKTINKVEEDKTMRFEQRVSMLSDKNGQRSYLAKNLRNTFVSIITPFKRKLDKLLLDKEERERIIENPNDILTFSAEVGKTKKRIQGYNVMKALTEAYYFISGFNYLITQGELSGAGILIEGDDNDEAYTNVAEKQESIESVVTTDNAAENANQKDNAENNNENQTNENEESNYNAENANDNASNSDEIVLGNDGFNESLKDEDLFVNPEEENDEENLSEDTEKKDEEDIKQ
ncbi:hypothetical protein OFR29_06585 [Brachyspira hyodysenteriae]|uniref:hypothetical protein n=1 Tax=Brachyspira hyodysenteriae TaxID=159 RepID=UPI0022CD5F8E|nr:hypothetical protein [Brachyspira hyodysenteriae]MCZ9891957.1 hypothetical protein [Brachyspira hyodysenteriae]MCZ9967892.1 hypothetical protein [Brachyspira hyodysenteriae]MCZ9989505.1 hypothetical protein [Brachyspira hyodysenteriae]MCZ9991780.1 hypothetical protein [Brachyspira hyodysenteriae]MCZ9997869.1 hypothetical protein [Brachyspira hyodysenteriae]